VVAAADGSEALRRSVTGSPASAAELGRGLAAELLADGAGEWTGLPSPSPSGNPLNATEEHAPHHDTTAAAVWRVEK
jgi:hypothetical protein